MLDAIVPVGGERDTVDGSLRDSHKEQFPIEPMYLARLEALFLACDRGKSRHRGSKQAQVGTHSLDQMDPRWTRRAQRDFANVLRLMSKLYMPAGEATAVEPEFDWLPINQVLIAVEEKRITPKRGLELLEAHIAAWEDSKNESAPVSLEEVIHHFPCQGLTVNWHTDIDFLQFKEAWAFFNIECQTKMWTLLEMETLRTFALGDVPQQFYCWLKETHTESDPDWAEILCGYLRRAMSRTQIYSRS